VRNLTIPAHATKSRYSHITKVALSSPRPLFLELVINHGRDVLMVRYSACQGLFRVDAHGAADV